MTKALVLLALFVVPTVAEAHGHGGGGSHHVRSYTKHSGTSVGAHSAKNPRPH